MLGVGEGREERQAGRAVSTHLHPFGLLTFNHRSQCPDLQLDKCCFSGKVFFFIYAVFHFYCSELFFFFNTILICKILGDLSFVWLKESFLLRKKCIVFFFF